MTVDEWRQLRNDLRRSRTLSPQGAVALQLLRSYFLTSTHVNCSASSTIIALVTKIINFNLHDATGMSSSTERKHSLSMTNTNNKTGDGQIPTDHNRQNTDKC